MVNNNNFRFSLYQENILLGEATFNADVFNPFTRYSVDIREVLSKTIVNFQRVLSQKHYNFKFENYNEYDFLTYNNRLIRSYPKEYHEGMKYNPEIKQYNIDGKTIRGVECKFGLYINENPIVERVFYVDGFNPLSRYSTDVVITVMQVTDQIFEIIKKDDVKNMWDDYDLINKRGLSINQIRELSPQKRANLLRWINR